MMYTDHCFLKFFLLWIILELLLVLFFMLRDLDYLNSKIKRRQQHDHIRDTKH